MNFLAYIICPHCGYDSRSDDIPADWWHLTVIFGVPIAVMILTKILTGKWLP